ncbi:hypothetical protein K491DRAFT_432917 [Lophiostoma macrostomum CBS 122681]|uniref:Uncharacterized protein n=1 Tax=Lophiostoma macrostomum CBS 122681 TaxID=1314788 RepID=A0A6A6T9N7_9PLEO|nr:hypothetical protein K491DRAFT_432917 [Lophiostoma macrostomum CBS 122681]
MICSLARARIVCLGLTDDGKDTRGVPPSGSLQLVPPSLTHMFEPSLALKTIIPVACIDPTSLNRFLEQRKCNQLDLPYSRACAMRLRKGMSNRQTVAITTTAFAQIMCREAECRPGTTLQKNPSCNTRPMHLSFCYLLVLSFGVFLSLFQRR